MKRIAIRSFEKHEWSIYKDLRLRALLDAPDAFGSTYAESRERPDAAWISRVTFDPEFDHPLLAEVEDSAAGLAWGHRVVDDPATAHVFQMWVDPEFRGRGLGSMLLEEVIRWARERAVRRVLLSVTCGNSFARRLYERAGFVAQGEPEPIRPGSDLLVQPMVLELERGRLVELERPPAGRSS